MTCPEINSFEAIRLLSISDNRKAIVAPYLILRGFFRVAHLRLKLRPVALVELASKRAIPYLASDPLPCQHELYLLAQLPTRLLETPHERAGIQPRGFPPISSPFRNLCA